MNIQTILNLLKNSIIKFIKEKLNKQSAILTMKRNKIQSTLTT